MASACVNNIGVSPETFSPYVWLSPRLSISRENDSTKIQKNDNNKPSLSPPPAAADLPESPLDPADFEFRLDDFPAAAMLTADKLFSGGKLVPLHLSAVKPSVNDDDDEEDDDDSTLPERLKAAVKSRRRVDVSISGNDPYLFSPKAPRCSSRWRELLGLKKLYNASATTTSPNPNAFNSSKLNNSNENRHKTTSFGSSSNSSSMSSTKSLKNFLHRSSKPYASDSSSLILPLLSTKDSSSSSDSFESLSLSSSRLSLSSSSSSGHDHDDLPRHSLDFPDKLSAISLRRNPNKTAAIRAARPRLRPQPAAATESVRTGRSPIRRRESESSAAVSRGASVDSPRMNSSGKIVFQSLERSSSSPSSFNNGGPRYKHHRPMERSYSANVRVVTPVLNVPVCSLRVGFGQLFSSPQKRSEPNSTNNKNHLKNQKNRPESNRVQSH